MASVPYLTYLIRTLPYPWAYLNDSTTLYLDMRSNKHGTALATNSVLINLVCFNPTCSEYKL